MIHEKNLNQKSQDNGPLNEIPTDQQGNWVLVMVNARPYPFLPKVSGQDI
jgi:hypothetical protein